LLSLTQCVWYTGISSMKPSLSKCLNTQSRLLS